MILVTAAFLLLLMSGTMYAQDDDENSGPMVKGKFEFEYYGYSNWMTPDGTHFYGTAVDAGDVTWEAPLPGKVTQPMIGWKSPNGYPDWDPHPPPPTQNGPDGASDIWATYMVSFEGLQRGDLFTFRVSGQFGGMEYPNYPYFPDYYVPDGGGHGPLFRFVLSAGCDCIDPQVVQLTGHEYGYQYGPNMIFTYLYMGSREDAMDPNPNPAGSGSAGNGSAHLRFSLGNTAAGGTAGSIQLHQSVLTAESYSTSRLAAGGYTGMTVLRTDDPAPESPVSYNGRFLRQVLSGDVLADVLTQSATKYLVNFYRRAQVTGPDASTGLYSGGSQTPFVTYTVENPDTSAATTGQLKLTESRPGQTDQVSLFTIDSAGSSTLSQNGDTWRDSRVNGINVVTGDPTVDHSIQALVGQSWVTASRVVKTYHAFPWGQELVRKVVDPAGANLVTTYSYYESTAAGEAYHHAKRKAVTYPDGSWERYDWAGNTQVKTLRPWKDGTGVTANTATTANCRATVVNGTETDEFINGQMVSKSVTSASSATVEGQPVTISTQTAYANASDTVGLTTTTYTYLSNFAGPAAGKLYRIDSPDGRSERHAYTSITYNGATATRELILHGTKAAVSGVANRSTAGVRVTSAAGQLLLEETYVSDGSADPSVTPANLLARTTHTFDANGNPSQDTVLSGRVSHQEGWTNGQKQWETDENGVETDYTYDGRGRMLTSTKRGVAASGAYAAQPDVVTTFGYDAADRQTSAVTTAGGLMQAEVTAYDAAGRVISQTQGGLTTTTAYTNGGRTSTTTLPGGATQVTDHYLDGQTKSETGNAVVASFYDYSVATGGARQTIRTAGGANSPRMVNTTLDWLRRTVSDEKPAFGGSTFTTASFYNGAGQLSRTTRTGLAASLSVYDTLGNVTHSGLDLDGSGSLETNSATDRVTGIDTSYQRLGGNLYRVTTTSVYNNAGATTTISRSEQLTGLAASVFSKLTMTDAGGNVTVSTTTVDLANRQVTTTTNVPGAGNAAVQVTCNGLLASASSPAMPTPVSLTYDALGRPGTVTDPGTGAVTMTTYDPATGQASSIVTANGALGTSTANVYYAANEASPGRLKSKTTDGRTTTYTYTPRGEVWQVRGDTYPLTYTYDDYGAPKTLTTTGAAGDAVTTWKWEEATGLLQQKLDHSQKGPTYTYWPFGQIKTRTWARGVTTTYGYDGAGTLAGLSYDDGLTPGVTLHRDRRGRPDSVTDAAGTHTLGYTADGQLTADTIGGGGLLAGTGVSVGYDGLLRRNALTATGGGGTFLAQGYGYDPASGNLSSVTDATNGSSVAYGYQPGSTRLASTTFSRGGAVRLTTTRVSDGLGRLSAIINMAEGGSTVSAHAYAYNAQGQRREATLADGSVWTYGYNTRGELTAGHRAWNPSGTAVAGQQFDYNFDAIGNRTNTTVNGRGATYTPNALNQYVSRQVPGAVDVLGAADPAATVTVNNLPVDGRGPGGYFSKILAVNNANAPVAQAVDVLALRAEAGASGADVVAETQGGVFVAQNPESFLYDDDGNLTRDGRWTYAWDAENRLVTMTAISTVPAAAKKQLTFAYDWTNRRVQKWVFGWNEATAAYNSAAASTIRFIYDGWNLVAELDGNNAALRTYVWGLDLSDTLQGAGGVGGLLALNDYAVVGVGARSHFVSYDGNGNLTVLVNASDSTITAQYVYGPFGENLRASGSIARANPIRWSSKYTDEESGLCYYGFRFYQPQTGRWISRDPIDEQGGMNIYGFCNSDSVNLIDSYGMFMPSRPVPPPTVQTPIVPRVTPSISVGVSGGSPMQPSLPLFPVIPVNEPDAWDNGVLPGRWSEAEINQMIEGGEEQARIACSKLAAKTKKNSYYYLSPEWDFSPWSRRRARGAAAVLRGTNKSRAVAVDPPGYKAVQLYRGPGAMVPNRGHLMPRIYGGTGGYENIVTQEASFNQVAFRREFEYKIDKALAQPDATKCGVCAVAIARYRGGYPDPYSFRSPRPAPYQFYVLVVGQGFYYVNEVAQPVMTGDFNAVTSEPNAQGLGVREAN